MQSTLYETISPPPRELARRIVFMSIFGDMQTWLGIIFFGIGLFASIFLLPFVDFSIYKFLTTPLESAQGWVLGSAPANMTVNDEPVYKIDYAYHDASDRLWHGSGLSTKRFEAEAAVNVEYLRDESMVSRLHEGEHLEYFMFLGLIPASFTLAGLIIMFFMIPVIRKRLYLLREGMFTAGQFKAKSSTYARINNRPVMKYEYEFKAQNGLLYAVYAKTHRQDRMPEANAGILYASEDPKNALVLEALPFDFSINETRQITATAARETIVLFIVFGISLAMMIAGAVIFFMVQHQ